MKFLRPQFALALTLLAACGGGDSQPSSPDEPTEVTPEVEPAKEPAAKAAPWVVTPTSIRYVEGEHLISVQADIDAPDGATRDEPVYIGVTVVTPEGEEIDLMVQTLFPGAFDQGVLFSASIDGKAQDVLIGVWGTKVEPCEVDRYGCREFGFVLDNSLGSWPKGLYTDAKRRRIPPAELTVVVHGAEAVASKAASGLEASLEAPLGVFGSKAAVTVEAGSSDAPKAAVVKYGHKNDELLATDIGEMVKGELGLESVTVAFADAAAIGATFRVELE